VVAKVELAGADVRVPDPDARGVEANQHLIRRGRRNRQRLHAEDVGAAEPIDGCSLHRLRN
jgi:hypothetical protein